MDSLFIVRCHDGSYTVVALKEMIAEARSRTTEIHTFEQAFQFASRQAGTALRELGPDAAQLVGDYRSYVAVESQTDRCERGLHTIIPNVIGTGVGCSNCGYEPA